MAIEYRIALHARTPSGFENLGEFVIGNDRQAANELFNSMKSGQRERGDGENNGGSGACGEGGEAATIAQNRANKRR